MTQTHEPPGLDFEFTSLGETCRGRCSLVSHDAPTVLMATGSGDMGAKGETWTKLPRRLRRHGISSIVFDFAGQGHSDGDRRALTLSKGVRNLEDALRHILGWDWVRPEALALLGSSYGGNVVLAHLASEDRAPVLGASLKSPCIDLRESHQLALGTDGMAAWERDGYSSEAGQNWSVIEDADASRLDERLHRITVPLLITHGTADESVPITQARRVRDRAGGVVDLVEMKGVNHHYSDRDDWDRMAAVHVGWLQQLFAGAATRA